MTLPDQALADLIAAARRASSRAYCPYSRFPVGAAVLTAQNEIFAACNVENASYGLTICAERSAIFQAIALAQPPLAIHAVVVYTPTPAPTAPCGACRQVIHEFGPDAEVISVCDGPSQLKTPLAALLPGAFGPRNLKP